jgi:hypothetical protein
MLEGHDLTQDQLPQSHDFQPFGYLYSSWDAQTGETAPELEGHYDEEAQIWVTPNGDITMGVYTKTRTSGCPGDCPTDDVCQ